MLNDEVPRINARENASVLGKAFLILDTFRPDKQYLTMPELTSRTGLPKSTTHRIVNQLIDWGALRRVDVYITLGAKLFELSALMPTRILQQTARPFLEDLRRSTREAVHLAILDDSDALYLEKLQSIAPFSALSRVGGRVPAHTTSVGKVMLAHLRSAELDLRLQNLEQHEAPLDIERLRNELMTAQEQGIAHDRGEAVPGVTCIAAPIFGQGRLVVAAISVMTPTNRMNRTEIEPALRVTATAISRSLGRSGGHHFGVLQFK